MRELYKTQTGTRRYSRAYGRDEQTANQEQNQKKKTKIVKLQQKLEASQRKIAILRSYNVELEAGRKL